MALGKKVKTLYLSYAETLATGTDEWVSARVSHTFQDDVRIIGFQLGCDLQIPDGAVNADHEIKAGVELSRHGTQGQDGALGRAGGGGTWTAAIVAPTGQDLAKSPFAFPDGHGVDLDDGEVIYLHSFRKNVGTVACTSEQWAIVYYVER